MARGQRQGHVAAVGAADDRRAACVDALVPGQQLHGVDMVEAVLAAPIAIDVLHVTQPVAGAAAGVGHEDGKAVERQELDERHGEPREIGPLLPLWPAVDVVDQRPRPLVAKLR